MPSDEEKLYIPSWEDDRKWTALLSPIRSSTANAEGVASKIELWKKNIHSYCKSTGSFTFTCDDIVKEFTRKGRTPQCIPTIIEEMAKSGEIYNINDFLEMKPTSTQPWSMWAWEVTKMPMHWAWKKMKNAVFPAFSNNCKLIHKKTMQEKAGEILRHAPDLKGNVIQLGDLVATCKWPDSQLVDMLLAIHWLVIQNKAAVDEYNFDNPFKVLVKIANVNEEKVFISEKDICKYNLLKAINQAEARITEYDAKIELAREQARVQLKKKCKDMAMCYLRKKQRYESVINQQACVLNNLHHLLETLDQTEVNQEIYETLKTVNAAIKNINKESNITEDSVLELMDDVRDTVEAQADMDSALSKSILDEDNEKLEKELDDLLREQATEDELCKFVTSLKLPDLPEAPLEVPSRVPEANVVRQATF